MPPISVMKIETTIAKIGRSMKKWESFMERAGSVRLRFELDLAGLRRDFRPGPRAQESVDDDPVLRGKARADDAEIVVDRARAHDLGLDGAVVPHHHHFLARLVRDDGGVGYQDRLIGLG